MATYDASKLVERGDAVEPGWGRDVVYVDDEDPQIRCTATTSNGESLTLAPFTGTHREIAQVTTRRHQVLGSRRVTDRPWTAAHFVSCARHDVVDRRPG